MKYLFFILFFLPLQVNADIQSTHIVFLGDSLTAGYGLEESESFPRLIESDLREKGYSVEVLNAGVSGDTTAGGLRRLSWILQKPADILFLALGANDSLRGLPPKQAKENLRSIIRGAKEKHPKIKIILAGIKSPPSMGKVYCEDFDPIYQELQSEEGVELMPFLLEGVAGHNSLNQYDLIHPNAKGHQLIANKVLPYIEEQLKD